MQWMIDVEGMINNAMTKTFTYKMKWIAWKVTLIKFVRSQTGRNGSPINYYVRYNINPILSTNSKFLDGYANFTPLQGRLFPHDAAKFHLYTIRLISDNTVAYEKVFSYKDNVIGQEDFLDLKNF